MTNFLSEPFENATVSPVEIVNSEDGTYRFGNENLSSFNFDGIVPTVIDESYLAQLIEPGMYFVVPGSDGTLRSVIEVSLDEDDPDLEMEIVYIGEDNLLSTYTCDGSDLLTVQYESWSERVLGTQGWTITSGGNAIFSNVAVRGDIEAQTLNVGGANGITYDGTDVIIGASVTILGGLTIGDVSASFVLSDFLTASYADLSDLASAGSTIINGGNITTGTINASNVNIVTTPTNLRGVKLNSSGLFGYDSNGNTTFSLLSSNGDATFSGDVKVKSFYNLGGGSNVSGSVSIIKNAISSGGVGAFPAIRLDYNYGNTFISNGFVGFGVNGSAPVFEIKSTTDGVQLTSSNFVIFSAPITYANTLQAVSVTGQNGVEMRQVVVSTSAPSSPGSYRAGTLWAVV